jgi:GAF domain-containing protein
MSSRDEKFAEFAWEMSHSEGMADTISKIVGFARSSVGADYAGITLIRPGGKLSTLGQTDGVVARSDALQHELGEGPCVDAAAQARHVSATDLSTDERWPRWGRQAVEQGLYSVLSTTMYTAGERRLGSLNLYGMRRRHFSSEQMDSARLFAAHATAALWSATREKNLRVALESRTEIGTAIGLLMGKYGLSADRAMSVLKRYSQDTNVKLREIAHEIVEEGQLPERDQDTRHRRSDFYEDE